MEATAHGVEITLLGPALRQVHQEASAVVAGLWNMPLDVQLVLGHHHEVVMDGFTHPLAAVVAVAEQLAREFGMGVVIGGHDCDRTGETAMGHARKALGLDAPGRMDKVRQEAKKLIDTLDLGSGTPAPAHG
jgi:hypothetical protein